MGAYHDARKGKRYRPEVAKYHANLEENILNLHNHLVWGTWMLSAPRVFTVLEPKMRLITAPRFEDRIVHHAIVRKVTPLFHNRFIGRSYACIKGRGAHKAIKDLQLAMRKVNRQYKSPYVVQADIKKFFASIDHKALDRQIGKTITCRKTRQLWRRIIKGYGFGNSHCGIPVGALTSQLSGNIALDPIDHLMTDDFGVAYYARYMDDIIILCRSKQEAQEMLRRLNIGVSAISLTLNPKTQIRSLSQGIDWCGYRIWSTHILPRKRNIKRMKRQISREVRRYRQGRSSTKGLRMRINSLIAYTKHCNSHNLISKILEDEVNANRTP